MFRPVPDACRSNLFPVAALLALIAISVFFYSLTWGDRVVGYLSDDAIYLLMAEMFSPWHHATGLVFEMLRQEHHFPPLYPVLLGLLGADSRTPALAAAVSTAFLIVAVAACGVWIYRDSGKRPAAVGLPLLFVILPGTIIFTQGLWSEFLFMAFFYGALALIAERQPDASHWLACSLFIALTAVTRAVGVAFIAGYGFYLLLQRPRRWFLYLLVALLPFAYWAGFVNSRAPDHGYFGVLLQSLPGGRGGSGALFHGLAARAATLFGAWRWQFLVGGDRAGGPLINAILALPLLAALAGFCRRLYHRRLDALCLACYGITVLMWPFSALNFEARFLFPLVPLLLFYMLEAFKPAGAGPVFKRVPGAVTVSLLLALAAPSTLYLLQRAYAPVPPPLAPYTHDRAWFYSNNLDDALASARGSRELFHALRSVQAIVPDSDCILSFHTALVMFYTHRVSGVLPPPSASADAFTRGTRGCGYMVALPLTSINNDYPKFYPLARILGDTRYAILPVLPRNAGPGDKPVLYLIRRKNDGG